MAAGSDIEAAQQPRKKTKEVLAISLEENGIGAGLRSDTFFIESSPHWQDSVSFLIYNGDEY